MSFVEEINVKIVTNTGNLELDLAKTLLNVLAKENFWILLRASGKLELGNATIEYKNSAIESLEVTDEDGHTFLVNSEKWNQEENFDDI